MRASIVLGVVTFAAYGTAFEMNNRHSPENALREETRNTLKRLKGSVAHAVARDREDEIMKRRWIFNATASSASDASLRMSSIPHFEWESEEDTEWARPYLKASEFIVLPANHHYSRRDWFNKYNDTEVTRLLAIAKQMKFTFSLSTGHCGTTTMSKPSAYSGVGYDPSACYFGFETLAQGTRDFARIYPGRRAARAYVRRYFLPSITELASREGKKCFVDFGHFVTFGHFLTALKVELGPRMTVVRLRRSRIDTAMSYTIKRKKDGPCGSRCVYCMCPDEQRVCLPVKEALWRRLTVYMKFLWMVDEVECRWHAYHEDLAFATSDRNASSRSILGKAAPDNEIEVSWTTDLTTHIKRVAMQQEFPLLSAKQRGNMHKAAVEKHKSHVSKKEKGLRSKSQNEAEDAIYRKLMAFTPTQLQMLRPAFF